MKVDFVLVVNGDITTPRVEHILVSMSPEKAKEEAKKLVAHLSKAGYYRFDLFDVRGPHHKAIASFSVEKPEPIVTENKL